MITKILKFANTIFYLIMVCVNITFDIIPIGIGTTKEISDKYTNLFTPAPVTFIIWGVIYLLLFVFILYQWGAFGRGNNDIVVDKIGIWFVFSCIFNTIWVILWHFDFIEMSLVFTILLLCCLAVIIKSNVADNLSTSDYILSEFVFDIYFGWSIIATVANVATVLKKLNWNSFGISEIAWTIIVLVLATILASIILVVDHKKFSVLAMIWGFCGILIRHISNDYFDREYTSVIITTIACIIVMLLCILTDFVFEPYCKIKKHYYADKRESR